MKSSTKSSIVLLAVNAARGNSAVQSGAGVRGGALPGNLSLFRSMTRSALQTRWQVGALGAEAGAARCWELPPPSAGMPGLEWLRG